jgi:ERCC4-type nuclease
VLVDDRERDAGVCDALRGREDLTVEIRRLRAGDYEIQPGGVVFERKTGPDFAVSILDGRLFRQALRLAAKGCRRALILEGADPDGETRAPGLSRPSVQGALVSLAIQFDMPVLRTHDPAETAEVIAWAAHQTARRAGGSLARAGYRPKGRRRRQLFVLQGLPGLGPRRATALLDRFGTLAAVFAAPAAELAAVDGVGPVTARRIDELIH